MIEDVKYSANMITLQWRFFRIPIFVKKLLYSDLLCLVTLQTTAMVGAKRGNFDF